MTIFSCDKSSDNPSGVIKIQGMTTTDNSGNLIGSYDPTDWNFDEPFSNDINALFFHRTNNYIANDSTSILTYPNPFGNKFFIMNIHKIPYPSTFEYVIVDDNQRIIHQSELEVAHNFSQVQVSLQDATYFQNNKMYRMYYKLIYGQYCYMGHGDIMGM